VSWLHRPSSSEQKLILETVQQSGTPTRSYFILLILSTMIAAFGLVANSTATVIGAMIVAPLMGPILGSAMGLVRADLPLLRESLAAEVLGVVAALATAAALALLVGPENIDLGGSELQGRTRPTLIDMGIGLSAGLAGAYATVNTRISASIAGVAIAVALVPPLAVCGIMLAGSLHQGDLLGPAFRSFMLFLANFLTIQTAAVLVFMAAGLGRRPCRQTLVPASRFVAVNTLLLAGTFVFLSLQLRSLVQERRYLGTVTRVLESQVPQLVPGAQVTDVVVDLHGSKLRVRGVLRAPQEVTPAVVRSVGATLEDKLSLPAGTELDLLLGAATLTYLSPSGVQFARPEAGDQGPDPNAQVEAALREALSAYDRAEMVQWVRPDPAQPQALLVTVRSPYVFDADLVGELQDLASVALRQRNPAAPSLDLTVRTVPAHDYTQNGPVTAPLSEALSAREEEAHRREVRVLTRLDELVGQQAGARLLGATVHGQPSERPARSESPEGLPTPIFGEKPASLQVDARIRSPRLVPGAVLADWQDLLSEEMEIPVRLSVDNSLGNYTTAGPSPSPSMSPSPSPSPSR